MKARYFGVRFVLLAVATLIAACEEPPPVAPGLRSQADMIAMTGRFGLHIGPETVPAVEYAVLENWAATPMSFNRVPDYSLEDFADTGSLTHFMQILHHQQCPCGCDLTLASCRNNDSTCSTSRAIVQRLYTSLMTSGSFLTMPTFAYERIWPRDQTPEQNEKRTIDLTGLRGDVVLLTFWATWCGFCRAEIPILNRIHAEHPDVHVIGLSTDDELTEDVLLQKIEALGMQYLIVRATNELYESHGAPGLPATYVLDANGFLSSAQIGMRSHAQLVAAIEAAREPSHSPMAEQATPAHAHRH